MSSRHSVALVIMLMLPGVTGCLHSGDRTPGSGAEVGAASRLLGAGGHRGGFVDLGNLARQGRPFYPLALGNQWDYAVRTRLTVVTDSGPQPPMDLDYPVRVTITGTVPIGSRIYFVQQEGNPLDVGPTIGSVSNLRQDGSGLYQFQYIRMAEPSAATSHAPAHGGASAASLAAYVDRAVGPPAKRAAFRRAGERLLARLEAMRQWAIPGGGPVHGGPDPGETTQLAYPLSVGARWVVETSPRFTREVVARENLVLPAGLFAAWRLHGASEFYGPNDRVRFWYSAAGLLRVSVQTEMIATDESGNVIGRMHGVADQVLTALKLYDPDAPHALALAVPGAGAE